MKLIAELCQNHNGKEYLLTEMVYRAKEAGADACKIQTFFADDLAESWKGKDYERLKGLELNFGIHEKFVGLCRKLEMEPMTSVYTSVYNSYLKDCGFMDIKIGSGQSQDFRLMRKLHEDGFFVYASTGGLDFVGIHMLSQNTHLRGVFHCVSEYPANPNKADMLRMIELMKKFPACEVGFSDHTDPHSNLWDVPSKLAMYLDADMLEKHFTILPKDQTKDGPVSIDFKQLKDLAEFKKKPKDQMLEEFPWFGMFRFPKPQSEIELIERYRGRWKYGDDLQTVQDNNTL